MEAQALHTLPIFPIPAQPSIRIVFKTNLGPTIWLNHMIALYTHFQLPTVQHMLPFPGHLHPILLAYDYMYVTVHFPISRNW